jgi:5'-3' exonuclease
MAVLPPASQATCLPDNLKRIATVGDIADFYPHTFECDLNGKRFRWQATTKLPFISEARLMKVYQEAEPGFIDEFKQRNLAYPIFLLQTPQAAESAQLFYRVLDDPRYIGSIRV